MVGRLLPRENFRFIEGAATFFLCVLFSGSIMLALGLQAWPLALIQLVASLLMIGRASARRESARTALLCSILLFAVGLVASAAINVGFLAGILVAIVLWLFSLPVRWLCNWVSRIAYSKGALRNEYLKDKVREFLERGSLR